MAATVITAPTDPPETPDMANSLLRTASASIRGWPDSVASKKYPMMLAVKKPARLAPPAAATIMGRGQSPGSAVQPLISIHEWTASLSLSSVLTTFPAVAVASMRRTE